MKTSTMIALTQKTNGAHYVSTLPLQDPIFVWYYSVPIKVANSPKLFATALLHAELLLSGAGKLDREAFLDAINLLGASISVSYSAGLLTIKVTGQAAVHTKAKALVSAMLLEPHFKPTELKRAKVISINAFELSKEDARAVARATLYRAVYPENHLNYPFTPEAVIEAIKGVTKSDIAALHEIFLLERVFVTVGGSDLTNNAGISIARKYFSGQLIDYAEAPPHKTLKPALSLTAIPSKENVEYSFGGLAPIMFNDVDYPALLLGITIFGKWGGFTGRLMQRVREKKGLTYSIYARLTEVSPTEHGFWRIMTFFAPNKSVEGVAEVLKEYRLLISRGVTDEEVTRAKTVLTTQFKLLHDAPIEIVRLVHDYATDHISFADITALYERLTAITRQEINAAIKMYLDPKTVFIAGAGPTAGLEEPLKELL